MVAMASFVWSVESNKWPVSAALTRALLDNNAALLPEQLLKIGARLQAVKLPLRNTVGEPWHGALQRLRDTAGSAPATRAN